MINRFKGARPELRDLLHRTLFEVLDESDQSNTAAPSRCAAVFLFAVERREMLILKAVLHAILKVYWIWAVIQAREVARYLRIFSTRQNTGMQIICPVLRAFRIRLRHK
jgi:hypothetical protein